MSGEPVHWIDRLAAKVEQYLRKRGKEEYVFNGGLSVSGLQHIGRLRGEVLIPEALRKILEAKGYRIRQILTLYTQDPWKGKKEQRAQFSDPEEAKKYTGWPLFKVPDPKGCHSNWVEHYWSDFGPYLGEFTDGRIDIVTTTELYKGPFKEFIMKIVIPRREEFRATINKYRGRKPYPEGWIPVEPICENCGRIDKTVALNVSSDEIVEYKCKSCGHHGRTHVSNAKLNWRIEWAGIWYILNVDFEPYGKDHATPGGSRDSCVDLARNVIGFEPPQGEWYEWVAIRANGKTSDMSSSGFVGITPREWLEIAHPQILRYIYFSVDPHKKIIVDLERIPQYYDQYYRAERVYFGAEDVEDDVERKYLVRTYELSHPVKPPERLPVQVPYAHMAILAQIIGPGNVEEALKRLRKTGHVTGDVDDYSLSWIAGLLEKSYNWAIRYAPGNMRFEIVGEIDSTIREGLRYRDALCVLAKKLKALDYWSEDNIKNAMIEATAGMSAKDRREFYKEFYRLFLGRDYGPRAAPLLSLLDKDFVVGRLEEACK